MIPRRQLILFCRDTIDKYMRLGILDFSMQGVQRLRETCETLNVEKSEGIYLQGKLQQQLTAGDWRQSLCQGSFVHCWRHRTGPFRLSLLTLSRNDIKRLMMLLRESTVHLKDYDSCRYRHNFNARLCCTWYSVGGLHASPDLIDPS